MNINLVAPAIARIQEQSMFDTCLINSSASTTDTYGDIIRTWTSGSSSASSICGVAINSGGKKYGDGEIIQSNDIKIRLPLSTTVDALDTITLTRRNNTVITETYSILNIDIGSGNLVLKCQKLTV